MARKGIAYELQERNTAFSLWFIGIFTLSFVFLYTIDVVPDPTARWDNAHGGVAIATAEAADRTQNNAENSTPTAAEVSITSEMPVRIVIDSMGLNATVGNPPSADDATMNLFLKSGAVRYPTSHLLGMNGTVVLFGHSSYLPVVKNPAFRTFNNIQKLKHGDDISVYSATREYRYEVTAVREESATTGSVALHTDAQYLVLVTCDTFGQKSDRFVVEAKFVGIYSLVQ